MRYVAFLRGINVGGRIIKMDDLRASFEEMGCVDVTTVLQTGNVIFESAERMSALKRSIESGLSARFNYSAHVHVYSVVQLKRLVDASPFEGGDSLTHSYVIFFEQGLEQELAAEASGIEGAGETIAVGDGVIYWKAQKGTTLTSDFSKYLTKARYKNFHTSRNINTLRKIVD